MSENDVTKMDASPPEPSIDIVEKESETENDDIASKLSASYELGNEENDNKPEQTISEELTSLSSLDLSEDISSFTDPIKSTSSIENMEKIDALTSQISEENVQISIKKSVSRDTLKESLNVVKFPPKSRGIRSYSASEYEYKQYIANARYRGPIKSHKSHLNDSKMTDSSVTEEEEDKDIVPLKIKSSLEMLTLKRKQKSTVDAEQQIDPDEFIWISNNNSDTIYYEDIDIRPGDAISKEFTKNSTCCQIYLLVIIQILLFGAMSFMIYWIFTYYNGIAWTGNIQSMLNFHFLLMSSGIVFFTGQGICAYRSVQCFDPFTQKITHSVLFFITFLCLFFGFQVARNAHVLMEERDFYSLHSWHGIITLVLFCLQLVFGVFYYFILVICGKFTLRCRQIMLPYHKTIGLIVYLNGLAVCLTGLMQLVRSRLDGKEGRNSYMDWPYQSIMVNMIATIYVLLGICASIIL